jgi:hypothetical protein
VFALAVVILGVALAGGHKPPPPVPKPPPMSKPTPPPKTIVLVCKVVNKADGKVVLACKTDHKKVIRVCKKDGDKLLNCKVAGTPVLLQCKVVKVIVVKKDYRSDDHPWGDAKQFNGKKVIVILNCTVVRRRTQHPCKDGDKQSLARARTRATEVSVGS